MKLTKATKEALERQYWRHVERARQAIEHGDDANEWESRMIKIEKLLGYVPKKETLKRS